MRSITVRPGRRIVGRLKVAGDETRRGQIDVWRVLAFSGRNGQEDVYWFGRFRDGRRRETLVAINARRWASIEEVADARTEPPPGNWFVTPDREAFAFIEDVPVEEETAARALGGRPVEAVTVGEHTWRASPASSPG